MSDPPPALDRHTSSGYVSNVGEASRRRSFIGELEHENTHKLEEVYDLTDAKELGRGHYGVVRTVRKRQAEGEASRSSRFFRRADELFALKTVCLKAMSAAEVAQLHEEIPIQCALDHPNIARIYEHFEDTERQELHIVMEHCTGGALVSRLSRKREYGHAFGERAAATLMEKMLSAIIYCHHHGVVHRDIKVPCRK